VETAGITEGKEKEFPRNNTAKIAVGRGGEGIGLLE